MKKRLLFFLLIFIFGIGAENAFAAGPWTYTWKGSSNANWNNSANWTGVPSAGATFPKAGDVAQIGVAAFGGTQPTVNVSSACTTLTIGNATTVALTVSFPLAISGTASITGATITSAASATISAQTMSIIGSSFTLGAAMNITSGAANSLTFTSGTTIFNTSASLITLSSGGSIQVSAGTATLGSPVTITNGGLTVSSGATTNINAALSMSAGTISLSGSTLNSNTSGTISASSISLDAASTMTLNGVLTVSGQVQTPNSGNNSFTTNATGNTITGGIEVHTGTNLAWNGSGTTTCGASLIHSSGTTLTIGADNTINFTGGLSTQTGTNTGVVSNSGNITFTACAFTNSGAAAALQTALFNNAGGNITLTAATASTINLSSFLSLSNSGTITANASSSITGSTSSAITNTSSGIIYLNGSTLAVGASGALNNSGTITAGTGASITGVASSAITNSGSGIFTAGTTNSPCTITLNGASASLSNTATFNLGSASTISLTGSTAYVNNTSPGIFTLMSDQYSTATIAQTGTTATGYTGIFNVQRYVTGGTGYRGYRLFSSPTNISNIANQNGTTAAFEAFVDPTYLNAGMLTGGHGTGFDVTTTNPLMYLYDESRASSYTQFYNGKNVGIYSITGVNTPASNSYKVVPLSTTNVQQTAVQVPVGNSFLVYFVGTTSLSNTSPEAATVTATGYLNQGTIRMWLFKPTSAAVQTLSKSGTGATNQGLNQVGNPYASTILLSKLYSDAAAGTISPQFWELDPTTGLSGTYLAYNASTFTTSTTKRSCNYIVSGQGFFVQALTTTSPLNFLEDQKTSYPAITGSTTTTSPTTGTLLMDIPTIGTLSNADVTAQSFAQSNTAIAGFTAINSIATATLALNGLHLQLTKDSTAYTQTGIYFSSKWNDTYSPMEDAIDLDGATPKVYMSSFSSDGVRLSINQLADYKKGKRIKLFAAATSSGQYHISLADIANIDTVDYKIFWSIKK